MAGPFILCRVHIRLAYANIPFKKMQMPIIHSKMNYIHRRLTCQAFFAEIEVFF